MKVMIVDDHFVVRSGLAASLELEDDLAIEAEAESGEAVLELYRSTRPDVVLMDLQLPDGTESRRPNGSSRSNPAHGF